MRQIVLIILTVFAVVPAVTYTLWLNVPEVLEENHLIELAQAVLLFFAAAVHLLRSTLFKMPDIATRLYHQTLAVFSLSLFAREVDIDQLGPHAAWPVIELAIRAVVVLLWLYLGVRLFLHHRPLWRNRFQIAFSIGSFLVYTGVFLYGASWLFDKEVILTGEPAQFIEETIQFQATLLFFLGAILYPLRRQQRFLKPCK